MKTPTTDRSHSTVQVLAAVLAVGMTAAQLAGVDALAQHRSVSSHVQVMQLERVVVTGQRMAALPIVVASCDITTRGVC